VLYPPRQAEPRERELVGPDLHRSLNWNESVNRRVHDDGSTPDAPEPVLSTREHSAAIAASTAAGEARRERT
jgi:hypothetical protein